MNLFADHLIFKGSYSTDKRKTKIDGVMGSPGGCIYSGLSDDGKRIEVYTESRCPITNGLAIGSHDKKLKKVRRYGEFYCQVSNVDVYKTYITYEGECKVE
jgi:hypothetical protein